MAEKSTGMYTIVGVEGESKIIIKFVGNIENIESCHDTFLEEYEIQSSPRVIGRIFACCIPEKFLMSSKKQPILKFDVIYERPLLTALVLQLYVLVTITENVKSAEQFLHSSLDCVFSIEIVSNDVSRVLDGNLIKYPGNEKIIQILKIMTTHPYMKECISSFIAKTEKANRKKYIDDDYTDMESPSLNKINHKINDKPM